MQHQFPGRNPPMTRKSGARFRILSLPLAALLLGATEAPEAGPKESILLMVASWCAPCHAELRRLGEISGAAAPWSVRVVPHDDDWATMAMMEGVPKGQRLMADRATIEQWTGQTRGLPFSVAVDADGKVCGRVRGGLDGAKARALILACKDVAETPN